jgi:hypothetical protein
MHKNAMQGYMKHWVIVSYSVKKLQSEHRHSEAEECQLPACIMVNSSMSVHTDVLVAIIEQCVDEDRC